MPPLLRRRVRALALIQFIQRGLNPTCFI